MSEPILRTTPTPTIAQAPSPFGWAVRRATLALVPLALCCCGKGGEPLDNPDSVVAHQGVAAVERESLGDDEELEQRFLDIVGQLTPPPSTSSSQLRQEYFERRREMLATASQQPVELGRRIADDLAEQRQRGEVLRADLLELAAHIDPQGLEEDLLELIRSYKGARLGEEMRLRSKAAQVLAVVRPQAAHDLLEPWVREPESYGTGPSQDLLLDAWIGAADSLGIDTTTTLAAVATDLRATNPARHLAVSTLGSRPSELSRNTLREVMLESTGNSYLRRKAIQAIRDSFPTADAIALLEEVAELETDSNLLIFLGDTVYELELRAKTE